MSSSLHNPEVAKKQQEVLKKYERVRDIPSSYKDIYGVYRANNFVSKELCQELLKEIEKENFLKAQYDHGVNRYETYVDMENEVVKKIINSVSHTIQNISTFTLAFSKPGSETQPLHIDYKNSPQKIYNALISLHDMNEKFGPTIFLPCTNNTKSYQTLQKNIVYGSRYIKEILKQGDAMIYDSNILHCGTPNTSNSTRISLMISFFQIS